MLPTLERMLQFAAEVLDHHGAADLLINDAGINLIPMTFDEISQGQFETEAFPRSLSQGFRCQI